jgi:peptidoglycan/xylan/chitin deacetylase (PgdA/CDA1 family)
MPIPILMYHQVGQPPCPGAPYRGLTVHPAAFSRQMHWMHRLGYRGLSMRQLMPYLLGERQGKVFGLTFDDAYRNVREHALPVLDTLRFSATAYVVARQIGGSNAWDLAEGVAPAPLMDRADLDAWLNAGNEVGSHTLDHVRLSALGLRDAQRQITQSRTELEQLFGTPVTAFCYPYGDHGADHREMVREAGYRNAALTFRSRASVGADPYQLPRIAVSRSTFLPHFLRKCLTSMEDGHAERLAIEY